MNHHKAFATIETNVGTMTIFYNGAGQAMTAEHGDIVEELDYVPVSFKDAIDSIHMMYSYGPWDLEWLE